MILIGSEAVRYKRLDFRKPKDLDLICREEELSNYEKLLISNGYLITKNQTTPITWLYVIEKDSNRVSIEFEITPYNNMKFFNQESYLHSFTWIDEPNYFLDFEWLMTPQFFLVPDLKLLATIKRAHSYRRINWHKHVTDYHWLLDVINKEGYWRPEPWLVKDRRDYLNKYLNRETPTPSLNKSKEDFFTDKIIYYFDHDQLHDLMVHFEQPMYKFYQVDGEEVKSDKDKFLSMTSEQQAYGVIEETYVIALERILIPQMFGLKSQVNKTMTIKEAFQWAQMRIGTNLTSGFFRAASIELFSLVNQLYNENFVNKFIEAFYDNKIKPVRELNV